MFGIHKKFDEHTGTLVTMGAAALAALLARLLLKGGWRLVKGGEPPEDPSSPEVSWMDALLWAGVTGITVAVIQVAARRGATSAWAHWTA